MANLHTSRDYETELRALRVHTAEMGARCERSVRLAFDAFWQGAAKLAEARAIDEQIDRDQIDIHALALRVLALRQPVADDLRFLAATLKLIIDLERVGDEALNIAERAVAGPCAAASLVRGDLEAMGSAAQEMLRDALRAFVDRDPCLAEQVLGRDDAVDRRCGVVITTMCGYIATHGADAAGGLRVVRVAKYLERIADHATNLAEEVIFMVRGDDVRHGHASATMLVHESAHGSAHRGARGSAH
jgi:phosphate transport system protein